MRIAVLIISLCLVMVIGIQSCTVMLGADVVNEEKLSGAGAIGVLVAFLFIFGGAFSLGKPKVSMWLFIVCGGLALLAGLGSEFSDLIFWGVISLILATMSHYGAREISKKRDVQTDDF